jgi:hypothetical protein
MQSGDDLVDVLVTAAGDAKTWRLTDLLGRSLGTIEQNSPTEFVLRPEGKAKETMAELNLKAFTSLDDVLAAIETHARGTCRRIEKSK